MREEMLLRSIQRRRFREGAVRAGWLVALALLVIVGSAWLARPQYRLWKLHRAQRQAREFLASGKLNAAWLSGQQALVLNATNLETLRIMGDVADAARQPQAIAFRRKLAELEPSNVTNRLLWAQTALAFEQPPLPETVKALESVPPAARQSPEYQTLAAGLELKRGNIAAAEEHFQAVMTAAPSNHQARINLAVLGLRSPDDAKRTAAQQTLEQLRTDPEARLSVLRSLGSYCLQSGQVEKALAYSNELIELKEATLEDQLAHLDILRAVQAKSPGGEAAFNAYLEKVQQAAAKAEGVATLAGWMRSRDLSARALAWVQSLPKDLQAQVLVEMAVADLYAAQKKWREMDSYLRDQSWGEQEYARHALVALALRNGGDLESSRVRWNRAVRAATEEPRLLAPLAQMVAGWGWREEAAQLLWQIAEQNQGESWAWQNLASEYLREGKTADLRKVFELVVRNDPKDPVARNNLAAVTFLVSTNAEDLSRAHQLARECYEGDQANPSFTATYAWSQHLQGKSKEALDLLKGLKPEQLLDPGTAVYYGLILAANGRAEQARKPLELAAKASLLPEERAMAEKSLELGERLK